MNSARKIGSTAGLQPIERKIQAVFAGGLAALGVLGAVSYFGIHQLLVQSAWAEHSRQVIESMHAVMASMADAEAAQRSFAITGDEAFFEPYQRAARECSEGLRSLRALTADNADQQRRIDALEPLLADRLKRLSELIDLRRARGPAAIASAIVVDPGPPGREVVRRAAGDFESAEQTLLRQREGLARARGQLAAAVLASGGVLAVILLSVAVVVIGRTFNSARRVEEELRSDHARLEESMRQRSDQLARIHESLLENEQRLAGAIGLNAELERRVEERTAELQAANQELESFGYTVAHDLRAPLRAMEGFSQALMEDYGERVDGEARVYLNQIIRGSGHLGELIDGLLQLSRSVRGELRRDRVDLSAMAEGILAEFARGEPSRKVSCRVERGLVVRADARMMEIVMRSLLGNAWKYTVRTPAAAIRVFASNDGGERMFHVVDNGIGFNMAHSDKLFQPFQRLHRQDEFPGIGIGLATVQRIVHRHGGQIRADSSPGQGAEFCFSLALSSDDFARTIHDAENNASGRGQPAGRVADLAGAAQGESGQPSGGRA